MKNIIIGISAGLMNRVTLVNEMTPCHYANDEYTAAVLRAGATPILLPITDDKQVIDSMLDIIDGLIMSGGDDIDPIHFGEEPCVKLGQVDPVRDVFDMELIRKASQRNIPIFGICRGVQILNVAFGGSLYQDLSYAENSYIKHQQGHSRSLATHSVDIEGNTLIYDIYGDSLRVNSFHHQAVKEVAQDFVVSAISPDGIIEAIEHSDRSKFIIGVQWHPEMMSKVNASAQKIFDVFVKEVAKRK